MSVRIVEAEQAFSPKKEASYGNSIPDGEAGWRKTLWRGEPTVCKPDFRYTDQTGSGNEWKKADHRLNHGWTTPMQRSLDLDCEVAGFMFAFGFGSVSSASAGSGGTRHTFLPLDIEDNEAELPSTAIVEYFPDEDLKAKFPGVVIGSFGISGQKGSALQATYSAQGNGKMDLTTALAMPDETIATRFLFTGIEVANADPGAVRSLLARLRSFNWSWDNNNMPEEGRTAGSTQWNDGPLLSRNELGNRRDSGVLEIVLDSVRGSNDELDELIASTSWEDVTLTAKGKLIGGSVYEEVKLVMPLAKIDDLDLPADGDLKTRVLKIQPLYTAALGAIMKGEVVNTCGAYLTAAG